MSTTSLSDAFQAIIDDLGYPVGAESSPTEAFLPKPEGMESS